MSDQPHGGVPGDLEMDTLRTPEALVRLQNAASMLAQLGPLAAERPPLEAASAGSGPVAGAFRNDYNEVAAVVDPAEADAPRMLEGFAHFGNAIVGNYEEVDAQGAQILRNVPPMR